MRPQKIMIYRLHRWLGHLANTIACKQSLQALMKRNGMTSRFAVGLQTNIIQIKIRVYSL